MSRHPYYSLEVGKKFCCTSENNSGVVVIDELDTAELIDEQIHHLRLCQAGVEYELSELVREYSKCSDNAVKANACNQRLSSFL
jgi:hypothetical protein